MPGALLRTGNLREFKALGVDGQPVFSAALQLREAIRLKLGREAADCFAIPQPNEAGDRIDWYAPVEGDVVPWSAATADERARAYDQLQAMHLQLGSTSEVMRGDTRNREKQIFGRLLEKSVHFPDDNHVYLIDGKPVIAFWGFTDQAGTYDHDPLLCLRPPAPVAPAAAPAAVAPAPVVAPVEVVTGSRWWRWLWLLLLIPLLLLLLWLLRACAPTLELPFNLDQVELPLLPAQERRDVDGVGGGVNVDGAGGLPAGALPDDVSGELSDAGAAPLDAPAADTPLPETPAADEPVAGEPPAEPAPGETPGDETPGDEAPAEQSSAEQPPPETGPAPQPMSIPPEAAAAGSTEFLDGKWRAGAGIQDARTGKPAQLDYDFKDGKGEVTVRRGDGVECAGRVNAAMQGGSLAISNQGQASCSDGSSYRLPEVACTPGAGSAADCTGSYGEQQFPMSMKQGVQ